MKTVKKLVVLSLIITLMLSSCAVINVTEDQQSDDRLSADYETLKTMPMTKMTITGSANEISRYDLKSLLGLNNQIYTGKGKSVAVIDTGCDPNSKHFDKISERSIDICSGNIGKEFIRDYDDHGTMTSSLINLLAPDAELIIESCSYNDGFKTNEIIAAIDYAIKADADVISMSFGGLAISDSLAQKLEQAFNQGILLVASAGNEAFKVCYPAALECVFAVGAIDKSENVAYFSNYGTNLDCVSYGVKVEVNDKAGGTSSVSGTSFSAPIVAALAANFLEKNPETSPSLMMDLLRQSAHDIETSGFDTKSGYGSINANPLLTNKLINIVLYPDFPQKSDKVETKCFAYTTIKVLPSFYCKHSDEKFVGFQTFLGESISEKPFSEDTVFYGKKGEDENFKNYITEEKNGSIRIIGYLTNPKNLTVPDFINEKPVVEIASDAFANCSTIISIVTPQNLKKLGDRVFEDSSLEIINFTRTNQLETIGKCCFSGTNLYSIEIPSSISTIPFQCFSLCYSLKNIYVPSTVEDMGEMAFFGDNLMIYLEGGSPYMFSNGCLIDKRDMSLLFSNEGADIPNGVKTLCEYSIRPERGQIVHIPVSVKKICENAFSYCFRTEKIQYDGTYEQWQNVEIDPKGNDHLYKYLVLPEPADEAPESNPNNETEPSQNPTNEPVFQNPELIPPDGSSDPSDIQIWQLLVNLYYSLKKQNR